MVSPKDDLCCNFRFNFYKTKFKIQNSNPIDKNLIILKLKPNLKPKF